MERSVAVVWMEEHHRLSGVGKLELLPDRVHIEGRRRGRDVTEDVPLREIQDAHLATKHGQRIGGRATLVIERLARPALLVSAIFGFGELTELADQLSSSRQGPAPST